MPLASFLLAPVCTGVPPEDAVVAVTGLMLFLSITRPPCASPVMGAEVMSFMIWLADGKRRAIASCLLSSITSFSSRLANKANYSYCDAFSALALVANAFTTSIIS